MKRTLTILLAALAVGCAEPDDGAGTDESTGGETEGDTQVDVVREDVDEGPMAGARAVAEMAPTEGNAVAGTVVFTPGMVSTMRSSSS